MYTFGRYAAVYQSAHTYTFTRSASLAISIVVVEKHNPHIVRAL